MKELEGQTRTFQLLSPPIKKPSRYVFACQGRITLKFPPLYGVFIRYQYHTTCLPCKNDGMWSTSTLKPLGGVVRGVHKFGVGHTGVLMVYKQLFIPSALPTCNRW